MLAKVISWSCAASVIQEHTHDNRGNRSAPPDPPPTAPINQTMNKNTSTTYTMVVIGSPMLNAANNARTAQTTKQKTTTTNSRPSTLIASPFFYSALLNGMEPSLLNEQPQRVAARPTAPGRVSRRI